MPNLFSLRPVEIFSCVRASTSGLMRRLTGRVRPAPTATCGEQLELRLRFDVEAGDARLSSAKASSRARLADAGEDDLLRRDAGGERAAQLALGDHVGAGAEPRQRRDHRLVGVRLQRVADAVRRGRRRPRRRRGSGASASPSNSSRTACRPPPRSSAPARPRRGARRRDARNGARPADPPLRCSGSRMKRRCPGRRCRAACGSPGAGAAPRIGGSRCRRRPARTVGRAGVRRFQRAPSPAAAAGRRARRGQER